MRLWLALLLGTTLAGLYHAPAHAAIFINEILADPAADANGDGDVHTTRDEFVELANTGPDATSLANWTLSDAVQVRHTFGSTSSIPGYGFFLIFGGGTPQGFTHAAVASGGTLGLNNGGDTVSLFDASLALIDQATFGVEGGADVSLTRSPDGTGGFVEHSSVSPAPFSPGTMIDGNLHLPFPAPPEPPTDPEPGPFPDPEPEPNSDPFPDPVVPEPATCLLFSAGLLPFLRRRKVALLAAIIWMAGPTVHASESAGWERAQLPTEAGAFMALAVDPDGNARVFAASERTVFESTDAGAIWRKLFSVPGQGAITDLAYANGDPGTILLATSRGLYGSFDGGTQWSRLFRGVGTVSQCTRVAFHPSLAGVALLGTKGGLLISRDGGRRWSKLGLPSGTNHVLDLAFNAEPSGTLYVLTSGGVLLGSAQDNQWEQRLSATPTESVVEESTSAEPAEPLTSVPALTALAAHPTQPDVVYLATSRGVRLSEDAGLSWRWLPNTGLASPRINRLILQAHSPVQLYAATDQGIARLETDNEQWQAMGTGLTSVTIHDLAGSPGRLWSAAGDGVYRFDLPVGVAEIPPAARELLANFVHEPTIAQVQQAAVAYAEVHPDKIRRWRRQASVRALLPSFSAGWDRDSTRNVRVDEGTFPNFQILETEDRDRSMDFSVNWDLADLIWSTDQTSIDVRSKLMVELRDDILDEVTRLYFERRRLQVTLLTAPPADERELMEKELRVQELTALIDGMTGGYFADRVAFHAP